MRAPRSRGPCPRARDSLLPLAGETGGVTIEGARYPLLGDTLGQPGPAAISNEVVDDPLLISVADGSLLALVDREGSARPRGVRWSSRRSMCSSCSMQVRLFRRPTGDEADFLVAGRRLTLPGFVATLVASWYGGILGVGEYA